MNRKLSASMTITEFDTGYWYATELKRFAQELVIPSAARLRQGATKDQAVRAWTILKTLNVPKAYRAWVKSGHALTRA